MKLNINYIIALSFVNYFQLRYRSDSNGLQNSLEELSEELSTSLNMQKSHGLSTRNLDSPITIASGSAGTTDSKAVAAEIKQVEY